MTGSGIRHRETRSRVRRALCLLFLLFLVVSIASCAASGPVLERFDDAESEWVVVGSVVVESMRGSRDGADVEAMAVVTHGDDRFMLEIVLHLEPPARFVSGRHESVMDGQPVTGTLDADSVDFLGGQSTASSVGGIYRFEGPRGVEHRLRIPATELNIR